MSDTPKKKKHVPLFGKLAVKHNFISKEQLKRALYLQQDEKNEGKDTSLPEILSKSGFISPRSIEQLHQIVSDYQSLKQKDSTEVMPDEGTISLNISEDKLTASLLIPANYEKAVSIDEVFDLLRGSGVKFGIVKEYIISNHISSKGNYGTPLIVAQGTPPYEGKKAEVNYLFDTCHYRQEEITINGAQTDTNTPQSHVDEGDLLAEKTHMIPADSGQDVLGNPIPVNKLEDIVLRSGSGAEIFEDQLKIFATTKGLPFLSIEGKINVFPDVTISGNYGVTSGPVDSDSSIMASGIITGEYPIKGGNISAKEIRDADIDILGDINIAIGITGATIKAQGDIRARYIHGSTIETCGSVIVENEIMDSKIFASGICTTKNSKIITSTISAKRGIKACGIGSETSVPCEIFLGSDLNIQKKVEQIDKTIQNNNIIIEELATKATDLVDEKKQINSKISPLMEFHQQAEKAIKTSEIKINKLKNESSPKQLIPIEKNLNELKSKDNSALNSIRIISNRLKEITTREGEIPEEISGLKKEVEELELERKSILNWSEKNQRITMLEVSGSIASGTTVSGENATLEIKDTQTNVILTEKHTPSTEENQWVIHVKNK